MLKIEAGGNPRLCSYALLNKLRIYQTYRLMLDERSYVVDNAKVLPFNNKTFDYAIASHILEHVRHPDKMLSEIRRISCKVCIITSSKHYDIRSHGEKHFGFVSAQNNILQIGRASCRERV